MPTIVTGTFAPWVPELGVMEVMTGAAKLATLNPAGLVTEPASVVTVTSLKPRVAFEAMFNTVVI